MRRHNFLEELFNYFFILYHEGSGIDLKNLILTKLHIYLLKEPVI